MPTAAMDDLPRHGQRRIASFWRWLNTGAVITHVLPRPPFPIDGFG